jgi:hypothetical protein
MVYCSDCKYFYEKRGFRIHVTECNHPMNFHCKPHWHSPTRKYHYKPSKRNKYNSCSLYEKRTS